MADSLKDQSEKVSMLVADEKPQREGADASKSSSEDTEKAGKPASALDSAGVLSTDSKHAASSAGSTGVVEEGPEDVSAPTPHLEETTETEKGEHEGGRKSATKSSVEGEQLSEDEKHHSPGEEYKSESDDASGLLRGRRREASDEEDEEEEEEEDAISVANEGPGGREESGITSDASAKGEGAYESDRERADERGDGDADDEGDDLLDDESIDLEGDEGKAEDGEGEPAPAPKAEVKKPAEPFVVPTAGPFYMHDDRFGGEEAKRPGKGKKLWDGSGDNDQRWPHDMFEKLNLANAPPPQYRGNSERGRGRGRGGVAYERGGRAEGAAYRGGRGGRAGGRTPRELADGGRRNPVAGQNAPSVPPQTDPALLPTPQYNLELLQEFPLPQTNAQSWGNQRAPARQAPANGSYVGSREQSEKSGQPARGTGVSGGQRASPAWADSAPGEPTGWAQEAPERGVLATNRGRGGRRGSGDGQSGGRAAVPGRGEQKARAPQGRTAFASGEGQSAAGDASGWGSAPGGPVRSQVSGSAYGTRGEQSTGWSDGQGAGVQGHQDRARAPQGRSATVGTMTSPRPLEQSPGGAVEKRQQYQQPEVRPMPAARREMEVQTDLAPEVSPRNPSTTPRGTGAKSGPPPGFASNTGAPTYGTNTGSGIDPNAQYRAQAGMNSTGRSSPSLHLASEYVPHSAPPPVLPYGQTPVPPVGGYGLPPYPGHIPPYPYGGNDVTWVPVLNNPQANALPPPPNVYAANPYASAYSLGGPEAAPYLYPSQSLGPPEYAPPGAKQGLTTGAAISRPPSASTLWKPPASAGLSSGVLDASADAYGQRQSKPRRYTEMTFQ